MFRKVIIPILSVCGLVFALSVVLTGSKAAPVAAPVAPPAAAPFPRFVAGAGIVEAGTENIAIGSPVAGIVAAVAVKAGDAVQAGAPLFSLDDRELRADLTVRQAALALAEHKLRRLRESPRAEDLPPAAARVAEMRALHDEAAAQLARWEHIQSKPAVSEDELDHRRFAALAATARLTAAEAELARLKAGAWSLDIDVARGEVEQAAAQVKAAELLLDRLTVRAPVDGHVLQVKIRPGEFAATGREAPLVLLGGVQTLQVRADVDEHDAWRIRADAGAVAYVRGNPAIGATLAFKSIEPYIIPKRSLTGDNTERVDTRVLQVLYTFDKGDLPVYVGQQMDVFIEEKP